MLKVLGEKSHQKFNTVINCYFLLLLKRDGKCPGQSVAATSNFEEHNIFFSEQGGYSKYQGKEPWKKNVQTWELKVRHLTPQDLNKSADHLLLPLISTGAVDMQYLRNIKPLLFRCQCMDVGA